MIFRDGKVLLGKRLAEFGFGEWGFPGGHLEHLESIEGCARRELKEETGLEDIKDLRLLRVLNMTEYAPKHYIDFMMIAELVSGEPQVCEPDKMSEWQWFDLDNLPSPIFRAIDSGLLAYKTGQVFFDAK